MRLPCYVADWRSLSIKADHPCQALVTSSSLHHLNLLCFLRVRSTRCAASVCEDTWIWPPDDLPLPRTSLSLTRIREQGEVASLDASTASVLVNEMHNGSLEVQDEVEVRSVGVGVNERSHSTARALPAPSLANAVRHTLSSKPPPLTFPMQQVRHHQR